MREQNYRYLDLLNVLCVCDGVAIPDNQNYITERWLRADRVSLFVYGFLFIFFIFGEFFLLFLFWVVRKTAGLTASIRAHVNIVSLLTYLLTYLLTTFLLCKRVNQMRRICSRSLLYLFIYLCIYLYMKPTHKTVYTMDIKRHNVCC